MFERLHIGHAFRLPACYPKELKQHIRRGCACPEQNQDSSICRIVSLPTWTCFMLQTPSTMAVIGMMVAEAGSESQRNAERKGFRIAYTRMKWRLSSAAEKSGLAADERG